tara:strand:- start:7139 stop:7447 length:309 start_codon:yes stop_codon:yes gene_type:complete
MGLFVVNVVFGFSAFFLFLAAFGCMLGLIGVGAAVFCVYALLNYCLQQGWMVLIKLGLAAAMMRSLLISSAKKVVSYFISTVPSFLRKRQPEKVELLQYATH